MIPNCLRDTNGPAVLTPSPRPQPPNTTHSYSYFNAAMDHASGFNRAAMVGQNAKDHFPVHYPQYFDDDRAVRLCVWICFGLGVWGQSNDRACVRVCMCAFASGSVWVWTPSISKCVYVCAARHRRPVPHQMGPP